MNPFLSHSHILLDELKLPCDYDAALNLLVIQSCDLLLLSPDRFRDHQGQRVTPSFFLPFGAGPRVCVGESLARLEIFLFLSSLLQRMSFRLPDGAPPPDLQGRLGVVLQPLPYKVVVTPRLM